jgi:hypothetical protein
MAKFSWLSVFFAVHCVARAEPALPELHVSLGERNEGMGLSVPSGGDGENAAGTVDGCAARRVAEGAHYLYVTIDHPAYRQGLADLYVSAEVFDDGVSRVSLQFDQAAESPDIGTKYTAAEATYLLVGLKRWRTLHFFLPSARLGRGQNHGADFRFSAPGVAFRAVRVGTRRPDGFDTESTVDPEALRHVAVARAPGMEVTFGNDANPADAALFKALSVTSVESYVDWAGVEPAKGQWEWSKWDRQVAVLQKAGLKWVPFLIAGPAYATPLWFQNSSDSVVYRCLDHGKDSKVQSLFNPALRPQIERFVRAFAERYRDAGVVESLLLGVTGIYGESIYPAGPEGGWTARLTGDYHNHFGWWAGDPCAVRAFRKAMESQYGRVKRLNAAWGTAYAAFNEVATFLPDKAPNDRARADFAEWYQQAMTDWSVFWIKTVRKAFPKTPIYLCTGGDGNPALGADFTAQAAAIARYGAGVRITNEGSDYMHNFSLTREVATATRHYGTFCGFEPASQVDAAGIVGRIYNATASGARQLHDYTPNTLNGGVAALENFRAHAVWLVPRRPRVSTALYLSRETWALEPGANGRGYALARTLRDAADLDFVTRRSLVDGHLRRYGTLVLAASSVLEPASAEAIEKWVRKGGHLIAATRPGETLGSRLYDQTAWRGRLFAAALPAGPLLRPVLEGEAPAHWSLRVGSQEDEAWLSGDWNHREKGHEWEKEIPGATMRWTGERPGVLLPVRPGAAHTVRLSLSVPGRALGREGIAVTVNARPVGRIAKSGRQECAFEVPADIVGTQSVARLEWAVAAWKPSEVNPGSGDDRALGVSVRQIEVFRAGAERTWDGILKSRPTSGAPAQDVALRLVPDREALKPLQRRVGSGMTTCLQGLAEDGRLIAALLPGAADGRIDRRYATQTDDGLIWYDADSARIWRTDE